MKKTIKTAVAMLLALIMACGSMTAFAATPADIQWRFWEDDPPVTYAYAGELTVGDDAVTVSAKEDNNYVYFTFAAEEDGYYRVSSADCNYENGWFGIPEKLENGVYFGMKDCINDSGFYSCYYYLEKGEYVVGVEFYDISEDGFEVEFLGDVVDIVCSEGTFENLFLNYNVYEYYDEESEADYCIGAGVTIKFSNGEDLGIDYTELLIYSDEELKAGANNVEIGVYGLDYKKEVTITIIDITEVITKVELSNIEKYTALVEHYTGDLYYEESVDGTLTVTYSDGTTETVENFNRYAYLEKYGVNVYTDYDYDEDWDFCFFIEIAGEDFMSEACTIESASIFENIGTYNSLNIDKIGNTFHWMGNYFRDIFYSDSLSSAFGSLGYFFTESASDWLYTFAFIMTNTADIFSYLF